MIVPGGSPFFRPGGPTACLLVHGFTAMPDEMRPLGDHLVSLGHTVVGVRLCGHGTHPRDLARTRWTDWLVTVEDGLALLDEIAERIVLIGQSLGGMVALTAAARYPVAGVVAISTPFGSARPRALRLLDAALPRLRRKPVAAHAELGLRREADYPAYAAFPTRVNRELDRLHAALREALPAVAVPVLLIQSRADPWVPVEHANRINGLLLRADGRLLVLEDLGHSIALDPKSAEAFDAIGAFVAELT
jgi:carboxylesterase